MAEIMAAGRSQSRLSTSDLLARLRTGDASLAWKLFLDRFAPIIMHLSRQAEIENGESDDCFVFICEKLSDHNFRRLTAFKPEGPASFRSWLRVVVANLCIDWQRKQQGRSRPFQSIAKLSRLEQRVFKLRFEKGLGLHNCLKNLQVEFPGLTEPQLANAVDRVGAVLNPYQYWLLNSRQARTVSTDDPQWNLRAVQVTDPADEPEDAAAAAQARARLNKALTGLKPQQRLLLRLRYQQDLSLKEVARLMRLGDPFRARRQIQAALEELEKQLQEN